MSHKAGDSEKLVTSSVVTIATTSGSPWSIVSGLTVSAPTFAAARFFELPDPATVPEGMRFEVKDGTGNSATHAITVSAPGSVTIDGSTDADVINRNWGGKTFVSTGSSYVIANDVRETVAPASSGGSVSFDFGGTSGDSIPAGWTQTQTGGWLNGNGVWAISGDTWLTAGANTTSVIGEGQGGFTGSYGFNMWNVTAPTSTLSYNAGTLASGAVVSFSWIKDFPHHDRHLLLFKVNGITELIANGSAWQDKTFTIPATGAYIFDFHWAPTNSSNSKYQDGQRHNSCFIDLFTIS